MKAAEELEHLYERKLALRRRGGRARKEKEDVQSQLEERIYSLAPRVRTSRVLKERDDRKVAGAVKQQEADEVLHEEKKRFEEMLAQEERDNDAELDLHQRTAHRADARARGEVDAQGRAGHHAQKVLHVPPRCRSSSPPWRSARTIKCCGARPPIARR